MNFNSEGPELDLKLHLSPPRERRQVSPRGSVSSIEMSPRSSCVSRETSPEEPKLGSMMLVGCPRCLMYVMLMEQDPKCPKCKSTVLLDFMQEDKSMRLKKVAT